MDYTDPHRFFLLSQTFVFPRAIGGELLNTLRAQGQ